MDTGITMKEDALRPGNKSAAPTKAAATRLSCQSQWRSGSGRQSLFGSWSFEAEAGQKRGGIILWGCESESGHGRTVPFKQQGRRSRQKDVRWHNRTWWCWRWTTIYNCHPKHVIYCVIFCTSSPQFMPLPMDMIPLVNCSRMRWRF